MINENQFNEIIFNKNNLVKNDKTFFGSPLKKFITTIYKTIEIPKESFIISIYYLFKYYKINKLNESKIFNLINNINVYIFSSIIIAVKQLLDQSFNVNDICIILNISYVKYKNIELEILKGLDWNVLYETEQYYKFKNEVKHHIYSL
jgi:hypothetical protein